ncbi:MAG: hypothetical protein R3242_03640 [Akkermansiaceae bacterium]|nr:hypothetical protein [Akkermansiaceae bacterium]
MPFDRSEYDVVVASDTGTRDGIGVEISRDGEVICEIFRDDTDKTRTVWLADKEASLDEVEWFIQIFKESIPWDFINYSDLE